MDKAERTIRMLEWVVEKSRAIENDLSNIDYCENIDLFDLKSKAEEFTRELKNKIHEIEMIGIKEYEPDDYKKDIEDNL